ATISWRRGRETWPLRATIRRRGEGASAAEEGRKVSSNEADERLNRALAASLRQEIQAPATAITDFLAIIIEDARALKLDHMLDDLDHMRVAGARLNAFVNSIVDGGSSDGGSEAFYRALRHDLRTPLNAIIGYSELLLEDM